MKGVIGLIDQKDRSDRLACRKKFPAALQAAACPAGGCPDLAGIAIWARAPAMPQKNRVRIKERTVVSLRVIGSVKPARQTSHCTLGTSQKVGKV